LRSSAPGRSSWLLAGQSLQFDLPGCKSKQRGSATLPQTAGEMTGEKMQATVPAGKKGGEVMQVHTPIRIRRIGRSPRPTNYSNTCGADNGGATAGVVKEREAGKPARDGAHSTLSSNVVQLLKECDIEDAADALERNGWTSLKKIKLMDDKDVDAMKLRRATQKVLKTKLCTWKAEQEENEKNEKLPHTATTTAFVQVMTTAGTAEVVQVMTTAGTAKAMTPVAAGGHEELARAGTGGEPTPATSRGCAFGTGIGIG
jgi:hypothetical protein